MSDLGAKGRLLGVDYGSVRIGLSVSDPDRFLASPLETYPRRDPARDADFFRRLIEREAIVAIVLGLPVHLNGRESQKSQEVRQFATWLGETTGLPIVFWDERFTTVEAESALWQAGLTHRQRQARRDRVAAQVLLQSYLDAGCPPAGIFGSLDEEE